MKNKSHSTAGKEKRGVSTKAASFQTGKVSFSVVVESLKTNTTDLPLTVITSEIGNGNPLQFWLENSMDGGAWWATVYGVAKSQSQLNMYTHTYTHTHTHTQSHRILQMTIFFSFLLRCTLLTLKENMRIHCHLTVKEIEVQNSLRVKWNRACEESVFLILHQHSDLT